mgnify:CR=1 FL=1
MSELIAEIHVDCASFSFFQSETESIADALSTDEITLSDFPPVPLSPSPQPPLDSDNDCACE